MRFLPALLLAIAAPRALAGLFGGPTIDGDTYSYNGKGDVYDPSSAFDDGDSYTDVTLTNWDMYGVANLSIPITVETLTLANCNLSSIPEQLRTLKQLKVLNLAVNSLTSFSGDFASAGNLTSLNLTGNELTDFSVSLSTLESLDLSSNTLTGFPTTIFSSPLTTLYAAGNLFKLVSVSSTQFDFFAGLNNFAADFADVASCTDGTLVTLKGHHVCRVDSANPVNPTVAPSSKTAASASSSGAGAAAATIVVVDTSTNHAIYVGYAAVALLLVGAIGVAVYYYRASISISKFRGALHEETPLFFDSDKRANYQKEITAVDQLFPSNDVVLVTWRIDYDSVTLVKKLAKGAYGEVWIGRYRGAKVAVKRLIDAQVTLDASEDFVREIKLMAWLQHPKIVQFVGVAWTRLVDMLAVIEFMDSGDLRSLLEKDRKLSWARKCQYAIDIVDAIVYLHSLSPVIIHRDLKSRNILIDSNKGAKLGDFGISSAKRDRDMTTGVGTTRWLAPELARGETIYTEAVDIYSFGVILAELDTHELPFYDARVKATGDLLGDWAILQKVSTGELRVSVSSTCPPKIQELVDRCTAVRPEDRPAAAEIAYQLRRRDLLL